MRLVVGSLRGSFFAGSMIIYAIYDLFCADTLLLLFTRVARRLRHTPVHSSSARALVISRRNERERAPERIFFPLACLENDHLIEMLLPLV
jgi:hypothetical protein